MINNITIATADDIIVLRYDVNIYPVDLSGAIITLSTVLYWLGKFVASHFGNSTMAIECIYGPPADKTEFTTFRNILN